MREMTRLTPLYTLISKLWMRCTSLSNKVNVNEVTCDFIINYIVIKSTTNKLDGVMNEYQKFT